MSAELISASDEEKIKKEVKETVNTIIRGCEALDMDLAFEAYLNSADFFMIGMDGSGCDYQTYLKYNKNYLMTCSDFKLTTIKEEMKILAHDLVLFSWLYKAEATLKTGQRDIFEKAGATFLFKKTSGQWKAVYYHESGLPPTQIAKNH